MRVWLGQRQYHQSVGKKMQPFVEQASNITQNLLQLLMRFYWLMTLDKLRSLINASVSANEHVT